MPWIGQGDASYWVDDATAARQPLGGEWSGMGNAAEFTGNVPNRSFIRGGGGQDPMQRALDIQRQQFYAQQEQQRPFTELGQNALAGFGQYRETPEFGMMLGQGARAIDRGQAAGGMYDSSAAGERMAGFVNQLTGDEMNRQYQQQLNALKIGQGAAGAVGGAAGAFGQQGANIYGQQGQLAAQNALNRGNQQAMMWNTAGNVAGGLGNYLAMQPSGYQNPLMSSGNPLGLTPGQGL